MPIQNKQPKEAEDFKLKVSYWYVTHKLRLRQALVVFLILLNVGLFGYALAYGSYLFFIDTPRYLKMFSTLSNDLIDYDYFRRVDQPRQLQIGVFHALRGADNTTDFVVSLVNDNQDWVATKVDVQLVGGGGIIEQKLTFVYPGEEKYVVFFNQEAVDVNAANIRLFDTQWHRFQNFSDFSQTRLDFATSNIEFRPVTRSGLRGELPISTLDFTITNNTAFSYWRVGLYMILLTGNSIGGANFLAIDQLKSGQSQDVSVRWYQSLPPVSSVLIVPEVDILDANSYMPIE